MASSTPESRPKEQSLGRDDFIRARMFESGGSSLSRYKAIVLGEDASTFRLLVYEFLTTFIGPIPGALGLVLRKKLYRLLFRSIGRGVIFGRNVTIRHPDKMRIGDDVVIDDDAVIDARGAGEQGLVLGAQVIVNRGVQIKSKVGPVHIGDRTSIGSYSLVIAQGGVFIDDEVAIAGSCCISGGLSRVEHDEPETRQRYSRGPVRIGKKAYLGMGAIVLDGVTVGEHAIVQAGSVVMTDVAPHGQAVGVPARDRKAAPEPSSPPASPSPHPATDDDGPATNRAIRTYLVDQHVVGGPDDLADDESFMEGGVLTSVQLLDLVQWIEKSFTIRVPDEDILPEHFDSVGRVVRYIESKRR